MLLESFFKVVGMNGNERVVVCEEVRPYESLCVCQYQLMQSGIWHENLDCNGILATLNF